MFKIADGQVTKAPGVRYKKSEGFISQQALETSINATSAEDIKKQLLDNGFEKLRDYKEAVKDYIELIK